MNDDSELALRIEEVLRSPQISNGKMLMSLGCRHIHTMSF